MRAVNSRSGVYLALSLRVAQTLGSRLMGLLGRTDLPPGEGLWIKRCNAVHTFGMNFPIDVLFLDRNGQVVGVSRALRPNRISNIYPGARSVIELPVDTIDATGTRIGDRVEVVDVAPDRKP